MCGRVSISSSQDEIVAYLSDNFHITDFTIDYKPRYNVAPGQNILSIINDGTNYRVGYLKWGFVPYFAKDERNGYKMINAKAETLTVKPSFKESFKNKRCLVLANGFYEWQKDGNIKRPNRIILDQEKLFTFAGLWSSYTKDDGTKLYTCTIITTAANSVMKPIHDRMPVILNSKDQQTLWLNPKVTDVNLLSNLLIPYPDNDLKVYEVQPIVNNPNYDSIDCIKPL